MSGRAAPGRATRPPGRVDFPGVPDPVAWTGSAVLAVPRPQAESTRGGGGPGQTQERHDPGRGNGGRAAPERHVSGGPTPQGARPHLREDADALHPHPAGGTVSRSSSPPYDLGRGRITYRYK